MNKFDNTKMYYDWLKMKVGHDISIYDKLLSLLHQMPYYSLDGLDNDRIEDGKSIRTRYIYEQYGSHQQSNLTGIMGGFYVQTCSVLELMVSLSMRMEEDIMSNEFHGNRTGLWFNNMLTSLGIIQYIDSNFNKLEITSIIKSFIDKGYYNNGFGSLFCMPYYQDDTKILSIWQQMQLYIKNID